MIRFTSIESRSEGPLYAGKVRLYWSGWSIRAKLVEQNGQPVLQELHITPWSPKKPPTGGLPARLLRQIPISLFLDEIRKAAAMHFPDDPDLASLRDPDAALGSRKGRTTIPDLELARLAVRYEQLCATPKPASVTRALATEFNYSEGRTRDRLAIARTRGLLSPALHGKRGGRASPEALELVAADDDAHPSA